MTGARCNSACSDRRPRVFPLPEAAQPTRLRLRKNFVAAAGPRDPTGLSESIRFLITYPELEVQDLLYLPACLRTLPTYLPIVPLMDARPCHGTSTCLGLGHSGLSRQRCASAATVLLVPLPHLAAWYTPPRPRDGKSAPEICYLLISLRPTAASRVILNPFVTYLPVQATRTASAESDP